MARNPSPKVAQARDTGAKFGKDMVIILMVDSEGIEYASWGRTKSLCDVAGALAETAFDALMDYFEDDNDEL